MEVREKVFQARGLRAALVSMFVLLLCTRAVVVQAQPFYGKYSIRDGKMMIELSKRVTDSMLERFVARYDLYDLDLKGFLRTNSTDSLNKLGWKLEKNNQEQFVISKLLRGFDKIDDPAEKIIYTQKKGIYSEDFPVVNPPVRYGSNAFRKKHPFSTDKGVVTFFLRNNSNAKHVMLAGDFNHWDPGGLPMTHTDSGWLAYVKLTAGKHWYKFIIDGDWTIDKDNLLVENDGRGNNNSVFYQPNTTFRLGGFIDAQKVSVAGSFNKWRAGELSMVRTSTGWQLPIFLAEGTHTYRFVVDGKWMTDPANEDRLPNEFGDFNSVLRIGKPYVFQLNGYTNAKKVTLSGSFNDWRENELFMKQVGNGWQLPYTLGDGNYEYQYGVDGKIVAPDGAIAGDKNARGYFIVGPNYVFRLKGFLNATNVFLAGDFNNWSPNVFSMKKQNGEWTLDVHLTRGKHVYKFIVDGKWISDPANKEWEQNEFGTGNSVIWFDPYQ